MQKETQPRYLKKQIDNTVLALKAARLSKGLRRKEVASRCGFSVKSIEQLENGRCNYSQERIHRIVEAMGISWPDFMAIVRDPQKALAEIKRITDLTLKRKPRRNLYKIITKEARILRILRKRKGVSQNNASQFCGMSKSALGHIENGRTDLKRNRIEHVLRCLGYTWIDFEKLMKSSVLRDEVIQETVLALERLDDQSFLSAVSVIKALLK